MRSRLPHVLAAGLFIIVGFHFFALLSFLYWKFLWLDTVMHFAGGAWASGFFFWARRRFPAYFGEPARMGGAVLQALAMVALVGVMWEFYEFGMDLILQRGVSTYELLGQQGVADTMGDLFFDLLGGLAVALAFVHYSSRERNAPPSSR
ncbi:MAG: hypothetical protein HYT14_01780 [Candidatus Liptonbacteria bacterium]|nr:hypothetical protein [Candidatus Liptonbacteria bacterium]